MYRYYINCNNWTPTREEWIYSVRCIAKSETERIDKFVFKRDAKFALAGQLLIRYLLSQAFQCPSSSFTIKRTQRGRPYIDSTKKFDFNLSHHHHIVCIVGTFDGRIGCDTMEYRVNEARREKIEKMVNLIRDQFTTQEYDFILNQTINETVRFSRFNRIWSLKESYVKWLGDGISYELAKLNFCINTDKFDEDDKEQVLSDTKLEINNQILNDKLRFDEQIIYLPNNEQQIIALCLPETDPCQSFVELNINEILKFCTPLDENDKDEEQWWINFEKKSLK